MRLAVKRARGPRTEQRGAAAAGANLAAALCGRPSAPALAAAGLQPLGVPQVPAAPNHRRMNEVQGQVEQMSDRARERAVSIAEAVRAAGEGDAGLMTRLQHQQDDQLQVRPALCG